MTRRAFLRSPLSHDPTSKRDSALAYSQPITPNTTFFRQYTRTPAINSAYWGFSIGGSIRHPLSLSYADLLAMSAEEMPCTLLCAANPPGGERIGHANWSGVRVKTLMDELDLDASARYARLEAADGYVTSVTLAQLETALLAYQMNGETLAPEQGFPARLIVPGLYDYKLPRWIERIELTESPVIGDWEAHGWPLDGTVQTTSGIMSPRSLEQVSGIVRFEGYAFAGARAVEAIEISIDGADWMPVLFSPAPPNVWTWWAVDWPAPTGGNYQVRVRAWDSREMVQPNGSIHAVIVRVSEG